MFAALLTLGFWSEIWEQKLESHRRCSAAAECVALVRAERLFFKQDQAHGEQR